MTTLSRITFLIILFVFGLSACGGGGNKKPPDPPDPPAADTELTWDDDNWDERNWQ